MIITIAITQSKSNLNKILVKKKHYRLSERLDSHTISLTARITGVPHTSFMYMYACTVRTCMYFNIFKHIFVNTTLLFG